MTVEVPPLLNLTLEVSLLEGRNLVAKDRNKLGLGKATSSDPFVEIWLGGRKYGTSKTVSNNLNPHWNDHFLIKLDNYQQVNSFFQNNNNMLHFRIFDEDILSQPDNMGVVNLAIEPHWLTSCLWYPVEKGTGKFLCPNASGEVQIQVSVTATKALSLYRGNVYSLSKWSSVRVGLGWDMEQGRAIDLDASCVAVDRSGQISLSETVYYGNLSTTAMKHSGDEQEGDESIGGGGYDEIITVDFSKMPANVLALYFVLTVPTPNMTLAQVKSAFVHVFENNPKQTPICQFVPSKTRWKRNSHISCTNRAK